MRLRWDKRSQLDEAGATHNIAGGFPGRLWSVVLSSTQSFVKGRELPSFSGSSLYPVCEFLSHLGLLWV